MSIQSNEFIGIAEGIKSNEISARDAIASFERSISELSDSKILLYRKIEDLEGSLAAAYEDTDEDGNPNYGRISALQAQINAVENELSNVEEKIKVKNSELLQSRAELEQIMQDKSNILFEIQERARKTSQNITNAGGMYGSYSGVGTSLQNNMQISLNSLSKAANILDGTIDTSIASNIAGRKNTTNGGSFYTGSLGAFVSNNSTSNASVGGSPYLFEEVDSFRNNDMHRVSDNFQSKSGSLDSAGIQNFQTNQVKNSYSVAAFENISSSEIAFIDKNSEHSEEHVEKGFFLDFIASKFNKKSTASGNYNAINKSDKVNNSTSQTGTKDPRKEFLEYLKKTSMPIYTSGNNNKNSGNTNNNTDDDGDLYRTREYRIKKDDEEYERSFVNNFGLLNSFSRGKSITSGSQNKKTAFKVKFSGFNKPRSYTITKEGWKRSERGTLIYDSPVKTGRKLDIKQGKVKNFQGTCGIVSCVNILRMAGVNITEADIVEYASSTHEECINSFITSIRNKMLCTVNLDPSSNGGTTAFDRKKILEHFGIPSSTSCQSIEIISEAVSMGKGVIVSVDPYKLYLKRRSTENALHAITITSVEKDLTGKIVGFYVCDSNAYYIGDSGAKFYTTNELKYALTARECNITDTIIR